MNFRNDLCEIAKQLLAHYGTGPEETHDFRKAGVSLFRKINGKVYAPIGGGITSASTSVKAVEETDRLFRITRVIQLCLSLVYFPRLRYLCHAHSRNHDGTMQEVWKCHQDYSTDI